MFANIRNITKQINPIFVGVGSSLVVLFFIIGFCSESIDIKEELRFEENLKKRLEFICNFSKVTPTFVNGSIRKIDKTNISYIEPHRVIVKDTTFLVFNYSNDVYISNLTKKIKLSELEYYINSIK